MNLLIVAAPFLPPLFPPSSQHDQTLSHLDDHSLARG
jgi:hypothetical protein